MFLFRLLSSVLTHTDTNSPENLLPDRRTPPVAVEEYDDFVFIAIGSAVLERISTANLAKKAAFWIIWKGKEKYPS